MPTRATSYSPWGGRARSRAVTSEPIVSCGSSSSVDRLFDAEEDQGQF